MRVSLITEASLAKPWGEEPIDVVINNSGCGYDVYAIFEALTSSAESASIKLKLVRTYALLPAFGRKAWYGEPRLTSESGWSK
jgi:short-subunit dehydrogenase